MEDMEEELNDLEMDWIINNYGWQRREEEEGDGGDWEVLWLWIGGLINWIVIIFAGRKKENRTERIVGLWWISGDCENREMEGEDGA